MAVYVLLLQHLLVFRVYAALAVTLTDVTTVTYPFQTGYSISIHVHKDGHFAE